MPLFKIYFRINKEEERDDVVKLASYVSQLGGKRGLADASYYNNKDYTKRILTTGEFYGIYLEACHDYPSVCRCHLCVGGGLRHDLSQVWYKKHSYKLVSIEQAINLLRLRAKSENVKLKES